MRKLASIQEIKNLENIPEADLIMKATVLGWELVVKKDEFKIGDKCVYIEIDSIVPEKPEFEFLRNRKFRIRTIKLRGQISQGIALPLSILPKGNYNVGDDVTEVLGIRKYDPQAEKESVLKANLPKQNRFIKFLMRFEWFRNRYIRKHRITMPFPDFIRKTDEVRIQNNPDILDIYKDKKFIVTEKLEGMSSTYFIDNTVKKDKFGVCSRNYRLLNTKNDYWYIAKSFDIETVLTELSKGHKSVILQGEIIGEGIQKNIYKIKGKDFYAFNLIIDGQAIDSITAKNILEKYNIKFVPILETDFTLLDNVSEMVKFASGKSVLFDVLREGVVIRNYDSNVSFKVINPEYLLKVIE